MGLIGSLQQQNNQGFLQEYTFPQSQVSGTRANEVHG